MSDVDALSGGLPPVPRSVAKPAVLPVGPRAGIGSPCNGSWCGGVALTLENWYRGNRCKVCRSAYLKGLRQTTVHRRRLREARARYKSPSAVRRRLREADRRACDV